MVSTLELTSNAEAIPILTYHQIADAPAKGASFRSLYVSPDQFRKQMKMLKFLGYQGLSVTELMPYLRGEKKGKVVGITLDDGYQNNLIEAMPILIEFGFSATCYVVSQLLGKSNVWDRNTGIESASLMSKSEICAWSNSGLEIGAHTRTHINLNSCNLKTAEIEIQNSKDDLENIIGTKVNQFCYPFGIYESHHVSLVKNSGYWAATTTLRGNVLPGTDLFQLRRVPIVRSTYWPQFLLKLLTNYENKYIYKNGI